ncbi:MAG: MerR family transcriptional regulator [Candidatus Promineifilaceae bacterium]|nr:MerR family transcriptional regulator [Candidatus Promineifilaceae bacterium]
MTDTEADEATLTISQFGRMSQLSRKALRIYDDRGLLLPAHVDPDSGYRYYTRRQLATARHIRLLRLLEMPLDKIEAVLAAWEEDPTAAQRLIQARVTAAEKELETVHLAARLLVDEITPDKERKMSFTFEQAERPAQRVVSIRRHITVPAFHELIMPTLSQLFEHVKENGAQPAGDPLALYYGPVNEEDDGPVEIAVPFEGVLPPAGDIKVRELPAHKAVQVRTYDEYNEYPKLLEMWNALSRYVEEENLEPDWDQDMTTYEVWHDDETMTICWPVHAFPAT